MRLRRNKSIIGHKKIIDFLENCLKNEYIAQAYLFLGPEGVGKSTVARWFLDNTLTNVGNGEIEAHPDFSLIQREQNEKTGQLKNSISIEQIRDLRERLSMSSFSGGRKAALIENAEWMSNEASNALLKTLEEPTKQTTIILTAASELRFPETIKSRCQVLNFNLVATKDIEDYLLENNSQTTTASQMAKLSFGRPGRANDFLENPELLTEYQAEVKRFEKTLTHPLSTRLTLAEQIVKKEGRSKEEVFAKLDLWERILHDRLQKDIENKEVLRWVKAIRSLHKTREAIFANTNLQISLENFLINL
ncbi:MAG: AAA family ATPase [Candidatus Uhrbacteria bacterium]